VADVILHGGTVLTMDAGTPTASAIALQGGRVLAVGGAELLALRDERTEVIDVAGGTVCPGFIDAHHHLSMAAWYERGVDLAGCRSSSETLLRLAAETGASPPGEWIYAFNYDPRGFGRRDELNRWQLDGVVPDRPVLVMHFTFHEAVTSSEGLQRAGIGRYTPDPVGGRIVRDRRGAPTGLLLETAAGRVESLARSSAAGTGYDDWAAALERYCRGLFAAGITRVCDPAVDGMLEGYLRRAEAEGRLPLPVQMLFVGRSGFFDPPSDRLGGLATGEEQGRLEVGGLKLFADGGSRCAVCIGMVEAMAGVVALVGRAARLRRPALLAGSSAPERPRPARDGTLRMGFLHYPPGGLAALSKLAAAAGFQLATHAACNAGIDEVLAAYEALPAGRFRHRAEHLVSLDERQARRLAATGAIGVVQPAYVERIGDEWEAMPVPSRLHSVPLRMLLDGGVPLAGSSDAPVAPFSPLRGMQAAVTRWTAGGLMHQPDQSINALEALRLWTTGAALALSRQERAGVLRPGADADLVVLSANPLTAVASRLGAISVERTLVGGRTVYERAPARSGAGARGQAQR
jgi:predicted amidohydrolase YtcJ